MRSLAFLLALSVAVPAATGIVRADESPDRDKKAKDVSLHAKYESLPRDRRREFLKQLTADQMDQFIRDTLESLTVEMTPEQVRRDRQRLTLITGDDFERWGEKLLAEKRPLTRERILKLLKDPTRGLAWRVSFHGYLTVILEKREPNDAYEIGLSKEDVKKLRKEVSNIEM